MLRITRQTDYAVRVLLALSREPEGKRLSSTTIGKDMLIPSAFLARIVAQLSQAGLVKTFAGREGGLTLGRPAEQINLRHVVEVMEGAFLLSECMAGKEACPFEGDCAVQCHWHSLQEVILRELERTDFSQLAKETVTSRDTNKSAAPIHVEEIISITKQ